MTEKKKEPKNAKVPRLEYLNYFDGYTNFEVPKKNGKGKKIVRVYTDSYYSHDMSDQDWIRQKVVFAVFSIAALALFIFASLQNCSANTWKVSVLFSGISMLCLLFLITWVVYFIFTGRKLTKYNKRRIHDGILRWGLYAVLGLIGSTVARLVHAFFIADSGYLTEIIGGIAYLFAVVAVLVIYRMEDSTVYEEVYNDFEVPYE